MASDASFADFRNEVLAATDLVQLVGQTVALVRRGRKHVGLCPFHQEKTPSFNVDAQRGMYYCFGCKASGTAIDFVMQRDRVEFIEALRHLADRAGLTMPTRSGDEPAKRSQRQALFEAIAAATTFFENQLLQTQGGAAALSYLRSRGFTDETLRAFRVGFAPDQWDALLSGPVGRVYDRDILLAAGLIKARTGGGHYDAFRNRVIFPIMNESGQVIAFGGRVMPGSADPAKYLNSPETSLFSKSRCAFGISSARQRIIETGTVAVVEGYTDVLMAHQCGVTNVVSVLGTALTPQHVSLLRRFASRVVLLFDADSAGETAVDRALELLLTEQIDIAIATLPEGLDPDEHLLKHGKAAFEQLLADAPDALAFKWKHLQRSFDASTSFTQRQQAVEAYLQALRKARLAGPVDTIRWGQALASVSRLTQIPVEQLHRQLRPTQPPRRAMSTPAGSGPGSTIQGNAENEPNSTFSPEARPGPGDACERLIIGILLTEPERWLPVQHRVSPQWFANAGCRALAEEIWQRQRDEGPQVFRELVLDLPESVRPLAVELEHHAAALSQRDRVLEDTVARLERIRAEMEARDQQAKLAEANSEDEQLALLKRLQEQAARLSAAASGGTPTKPPGRRAAP